MPVYKGFYLLGLHPAPDPVQAEADAASVDPCEQHRGEVALGHLAGVVREHRVLEILQRPGVEEQDVGDGHRPHQPAQGRSAQRIPDT